MEEWKVEEDKRDELRKKEWEKERVLWEQYFGKKAKQLFFPLSLSLSLSLNTHTHSLALSLSYSVSYFKFETLVMELLAIEDIHFKSRGHVGRGIGGCVSFKSYYFPNLFALKTFYQMKPT